MNEFYLWLCCQVTCYLLGCLASFVLGILASIQAGIMVWELRNACGEGGKFRFEKVYAWFYILFLACSFGCLFYSVGFTMQYYGGVSSFRCLSAVNYDKEHLSKPWRLLSKPRRHQSKLSRHQSKPRRLTKSKPSSQISKLSRHQSKPWRHLSKLSRHQSKPRRHLSNLSRHQSKPSRRACEIVRVSRTISANQMAWNLYSS